MTSRRSRLGRNSMRLAFLGLLVSAMLPSVSRAQAPVFKITPEESTVKFFVKASVAIVGNFEKWDATLTFPSTDVTTGVLDIKIQADSVNTGSGMKGDKLRGARTSSMPSRTRSSRFIPTRSCRPVLPRLISRGPLPFAEYPSPKH